MQSSGPHRRAGTLVALAAVVLLLAACTDDGTDSDVRSPAPTGSLTPASSAEASASLSPDGDVGGAGGTNQLTMTTP